MDIQRKLRDIAPPKANTTEEQEPRKRRFRVSKKGFLLTVFVAGLALLGVHVFFATASVEIWPQTRVVALQETIAIVAAEESADAGAKSVPGTLMEQKLSSTRSFAATGEKTSEGRARGQIRVYNEYSTSPQALIPNTRFISSEGKLFRTEKRITVPGATYQGGNLVPGQLDVEVVAAEAGQSYNVGASTFSLPGLSGTPLYTQIYAKSFAAMQGGRVEEVSTVTDEDLREAEEALVEQLKGEARSAMTLRQGEVLTSVFAEIVEASSLAAAGEEREEFPSNAEIVARAMAFGEADVVFVMKELLQGQLEEGELLHEESIKLTYETAHLDSELKTAALLVRATATAYPALDPDFLKAQVQGKEAEEAESALRQVSEIISASVDFWPFWVGKVPGDEDRIEIRFRFGEEG